MSMIFQSYAIWPHMTVAENVAFGLSLRRLPAATVREKVDRMLDVVKLKPLAGRQPAGPVELPLGLSLCRHCRPREECEGQRSDDAHDQLSSRSS